MSFTFYFEDGSGNIVDENGHDPMDIIEEENPFKLEELISYSVYLAAKNKAVSNEDALVPEAKNRTNIKKEQFNVANESSSLKGNRINNEIKANAVNLVDIHPKNSARAVALQSKLEPRTVQRWYKSWKKDSDSLLKTIGRPRIIEPEGELAEAAKGLVTDFYFKQPTAIVNQLMEQLTKNFEDFSLSKRAVYRYLADLWIFTLKGVQLKPVERNTPARILARKEWVEELKKTDVDYMSNCVFIDEAGFNADLRRSQGWSPKGQPAIVKVLTARAKGLIKVCLRKPAATSKKRKLANGKQYQARGTVTNHYLSFINDVLAEMD